MWVSIFFLGVRGFKIQSIYKGLHFKPQFWCVKKKIGEFFFIEGSVCVDWRRINEKIIRIYKKILEFVKGD